MAKGVKGLYYFSGLFWGRASDKYYKRILRMWLLDELFRYEETALQHDLGKLWSNSALIMYYIVANWARKHEQARDIHTLSLAF